MEPPCGRFTLWLTAVEPRGAEAHFFCWFNKNLHDHDVNVCRASADVKPKKLKYSQSVLTATLIESLDHCSPLFYDRLIAACL